LPIFISASDTPGPYFFWPAAGAVAAIIAAQNGANARSFVIVSPHTELPAKRRNQHRACSAGHCFCLIVLFAETVGHGALDSMAARRGE
jgi:hypothetical protein